MPFTPISTLLPRKMLKKTSYPINTSRMYDSFAVSGMEQIVTRHSIKTKIGLI